MGIVLSENDYQPLAGFAFQHWDASNSPAFSSVRPLTEDAARRAWSRAMAMCAAPWAEKDHADRLDLRQDDWTAESACAWLSARGVGHDERVIVCFQPQWAITAAWSAVCEHWLVLLWMGGCIWPPSEQWVLIHDGDQFAFGRKPDAIESTPGKSSLPDGMPF